MRRFEKILLEVWRIIALKSDLNKSMTEIIKVVNDYFPVEDMLIRWLNLNQKTVETIALGKEQSPKFISIFQCHAAEVEALKNRHGQASISAVETETAAVCDPLVPMKTMGNILVSPLEKNEEGLSFLMLIMPAGIKSPGHYYKLLNLLIEPVSVAARNHNILKKMMTSKEASEADRKKLLTKLGRDKIGDDIVGRQKGLKTVMERVDLVAGSDLPVLIFGETGTGKELISRAIHNKSHRSRGPFIRVNCGAIPSELIDSQLFGHERGAFTGAVETRIGWFEQASGGTLFLDEVGELPIEAQVRFLRILQDGWLERVGSKKPIKIDVRIVLATNRDLVKLVSQNLFREDLWYRISTFPIFLPPLRDRFEDLPSLAAHFAQQSSVRFGLPEVLPDNSDISLLSSYNWPGNIRELKAVIDRASLLGNGKKLEIARALGWQNSFERQQPENHSQDKKGSALCTLDEAMKNHIEAALKFSRGKVEGDHGAAQLLKINPHTLRARMRKLGIDWKIFKE
jgi:transcriptional regulator with GAF, ATPase, and Fis domain